MTPLEKDEEIKAKIRELYKEFGRDEVIAAFGKPPFGPTPQCDPGYVYSPQLNICVLDAG